MVNAAIFGGAVDGPVFDEVRMSHPRLRQKTKRASLRMPLRNLRSLRKPRADECVRPLREKP